MNVPEGWRKVNVDDIKANQPNALSTGPFGSAISSKYFQDSGVPVIRGGNLSSDVEIIFKDEDFVYISSEKAKEFTRSIVKAKDIIFTCWGTINQVGLIPDNSRFERYIISNKQMKLTPNVEMAMPFYLYSLFSSNLIQKRIANLSIGSSIPGFNLGHLKSIEFLLPSLPEQIKISDILSKWDDSLSILSQLIDAKRQQKRGLAEQLLTGKRRLPGFEGEWENTELLRVLKESRIPAKDEVGKRITVSLHLKGVSLREERDTSEVGKTTYYRRSAGQFIYGKQNLFKGALGIVPEYLDGYLSSQDLPAFDVSKEYCTDFIYEYFARTDFYESLEKMSTGTGSKRIHPEAIYKLCVFFPPLAEQHAIADVLSTLNAEIASLDALKAKVAEQKRGLMDALMTGRVRVKVEEAS